MAKSEKLKSFIKGRNRFLAIVGILHSKRAFVGPEVLHLDLTNLCNFNCLACWCRSPLLADKAMPEWERRLNLPLDKIRGVFDDLSGMKGLRQVKLVGGGEPFMHPDILKIIEYIKGKDKAIEIDINTNLSLVEEKTAEELLRLGVDSLTVSIWAGTPAVYTAVHPNQNEETFRRLKDVLKLISARKKELKKNLPRIILHEVIFNLNYKDLGRMLEFALEVKADAVQFVPVDTVRGRTETLLLNEEQRIELLDTLRVIRKNYNPQTLQYISDGGSSVALPDFENFIQRIERIDTSTGAYDEESVDGFPCYAGWLFSRIMTTGDVVPCCKGHRMPMGNIHKNRFKDIWFSHTYNVFRQNGLNLSKAHLYFSKIGNDASAKTGCYNCDNLWQNIPMHKKISSLKEKNNRLVSLSGALLKHLF